MTSFRVLVLNQISSKGLERLPAPRYSVGKDVAAPDAVLVRSADMHGMQIPESVLAIGRAGAGTNNIPVKAMSARGVPVFNAPGANANAVKELVLAGMLMAARNLGDASESFAERGIAGLEANVEHISQHVSRSLMLVTALSPHLGYEKAARIAQKAHRERTTLREAALALGWVSAEEFDRWVDPARMLGPS